MATSSAVVDIAEYIDVLRARWKLLALGAAIGAVLGLLATLVAPASFITESRVEVRPLVSQGDNPNLDIERQVNTVNERAIASSQRVAERALAIIDASAGRPLDDPAVLAEAEAMPVDADAARNALEQISVSVLNDSQILVITAEGGSAERASALAQAMAVAYLEFRTDAATASTTAARAALLERQAELEADLTALADGAGGRELEYLEVAKREELAGIGSRLANLAAIEINPGIVLDDAKVPESKSGLSPILGIVGGALAGLGAALAAAFLLDRQDDRLREPAAELEAMGLGVLGSVPVGRGLFGGGPAIAEPTSDTAESYRRVQGSVVFALDQQDKTVVLVAGPNNPHSSTTVAANLAVSAARAGRRVLLVGADLRRPSLHERFGLDNRMGLSDVLSGKGRLGDALQQWQGAPNLRVLSAGTEVDQPAVLLQSQGMGRLVQAVKGEFDLVVFEGPPVLQVADAVDLAPLCDGTLMVVEPSRATRTGVSDAVGQLRRVGSPVLGTVVAENNRA